MRRISLVVLLSSAVFASGCYTKGYVQNMVAAQQQADQRQAAHNGTTPTQAANQAPDQAANQPDK